MVDFGRIQVRFLHACMHACVLRCSNNSWQLQSGNCPTWPQHQHPRAGFLARTMCCSILYSSTSSRRVIGATLPQHLVGAVLAWQSCPAGTCADLRHPGQACADVCRCALHPQKELKEIASDKASGVTAEIVNDNLQHLIGSVPGPKDTPYDGGVFRVDIQLDAQYPFAPPKMRFMTRVWHPNVSSASGAICLGAAANGPGGVVVQAAGAMHSMCLRCCVLRRLSQQAKKRLAIVLC